MEGDNEVKGKLLVSISFNLKTPSYLLKVACFEGIMLIILFIHYDDSSCIAVNNRV